MSFLLDPSDPDGLTEHLHRTGLLPEADQVRSLSSAGAGNMNLTLRADLGGRTVIVKQARAWVEKYPDIPAPPERAEAEAAFYAAAQRHPDVARAMPRLLGHAPQAHLLVLEDLGAAADLTTLYADDPEDLDDPPPRGSDDPTQLSPHDLQTLLGWLGALHRIRPSALDPAVRQTLTNPLMRALNHAHVFELPFAAEPPLDLDAVTEGLAAVQADVAADTALVARIHRLGARYTGPARPQDVVLHGDFYPGSWLRSAAGLRVIDPEFTFVGDPAFDRGVVVAHLLLSAHPRAIVDWAAHEAPAGTRAWAGVEVMRRLLGVAQLPLTAGLRTKTMWIDRARSWVMDADLDAAGL